MNKLLLPLVVAAIGSGVFAFTQFQQASGLRTDLDRVSGELAAQQDALKKLLAATQAANDTIALLKEDNERLKKERDEAREKNKQFLADGNTGVKPADTAEKNGKPKQFDLRDVMKGFAKQMDDPETKKMMRQGQERMVAGAYDKFFKKLGLSEQDSKLVSEIIADRNIAALDKGRKILEGGKPDDAGISAVRKDIDATKAEYDAKLKAVLGEQKFAEMNTYEQTVGDQRALDFFERNFQSKSQPLAAEQKGALTDIMKQERMKSPSNEIPDLGGGPGVAVLMSDAELKTRKEQEQAYQQRVVSRAAEAGLNPDQVTILQDSFKQQSEMREFSTRMGRSFIRPPQ